VATTSSAATATNLRLCSPASRLGCARIDAQIPAIVARRGHEPDERIIQSRHRVRHDSPSSRCKNSSDSGHAGSRWRRRCRGKSNMTYELHLLATGWNDFIAVWTRFAASRQYAAAAGREFRRAHQVRPAGAARGQGMRMSSRRWAMRCGIALAHRPAASTSAGGNGDRKILAAGEPQDRK